MVRFACELAALAALGVWGYHAGGWPLAVAAPVAGALLWGVWVAPKARRRARDPWRFLLELVVFGSATAALLDLGQPALAAIFLALAVLSAGAARVEGAEAP